MGIFQWRQFFRFSESRLAKLDGAWRFLSSAFVPGSQCKTAKIGNLVLADSCVAKNHQRDPSLLSSIRKQYFGLSKSKIVKIGWIRSSDEIFLFSVVVFPSD